MRPEAETRVEREAQGAPSRLETEHTPQHQTVGGPVVVGGLAARAFQVQRYRWGHPPAGAETPGPLARMASTLLSL